MNTNKLISNIDRWLEDAKSKETRLKTITVSTRAYKLMRKTKRK